MTRASKGSARRPGAVAPRLSAKLKTSDRKRLSRRIVQHGVEAPTACAGCRTHGLKCIVWHDKAECSECVSSGCACMPTLVSVSERTDTRPRPSDRAHTHTPGAPYRNIPQSTTVESRSDSARISVDTRPSGPESRHRVYQDSPHKRLPVATEPVTLGTSRGQKRNQHEDTENSHGYMQSIPKTETDLATLSAPLTIPDSQPPLADFEDQAADEVSSTLSLTFRTVSSEVDPTETVVEQTLAHTRADGSNPRKRKRTADRRPRNHQTVATQDTSCSADQKPRDDSRTVAYRESLTSASPYDMTSPRTDEHADGNVHGQLNIGKVQLNRRALKTVESGTHDTSAASMFRSSAPAARQTNPQSQGKPMSGSGPYKTGIPDFNLLIPQSSPSPNSEISIGHERAAFPVSAPQCRSGISLRTMLKLEQRNSLALNDDNNSSIAPQIRRESPIRRPALLPGATCDLEAPSVYSEPEEDRFERYLNSSDFPLLPNSDTSLSAVAHVPESAREFVPESVAKRHHSVGRREDSKLPPTRTQRSIQARLDNHSEGRRHEPFVSKQKSTGASRSPKGSRKRVYGDVKEMFLRQNSKRWYSSPISAPVHEDLARVRPLVLNESQSLSVFGGITDEDMVAAALPSDGERSPVQARVLRMQASPTQDFQLDAALRASILSSANEHQTAQVEGLAASISTLEKQNENLVNQTEQLKEQHTRQVLAHQELVYTNIALARECKAYRSQLLASQSRVKSLETDLWKKHEQCTSPGHDDELADCRSRLIVARLTCERQDRLLRDIRRLVAETSAKFQESPIFEPPHVVQSVHGDRPTTCSI